ncbi:hypothetical protein [Allosalinactinospora lopnorensis]|uniref:hypothetical protein n=1 Tax=Allosalinactinospora lopnorensis TaxID=1352348 RepID=UPI0012E2A1B8|nr:hypothetical protein [Allosalinactinospora lopnorensis]
MRVPAAWVLLGAVGAQMLGGLIYIFGAGGYESSPAHTISAIGHSAFFGPIIVALILGAVFLVVTAPQRSAAFPVVLTALILSGTAALMGVITLIMGFVAANDNDTMGVGFASFFETAGYLAILGFAGLFLLKVFGDQNLVPRAAPVSPMGHPGHPQGFAPHTGAQQPFGPQVNQGYATGAQPSFQQDWAQQGYADPAQQQAYVDPSQHPYADQYQQVQQPYADPAYQQPAQQGYGDPGQYADPNQGAYGQAWSQPGDPYSQPSGGHQAYGQDWQYQQQAYNQNWPVEQQMPYAGQPGYTSGGQPAGYDAYASPGYGTGGQQAYSGAYDPSQYAPMPPGADPGQPGEQAAQEAVQYGWYQQPADQGGERRDTPMGQFFGSEEQNANDAAQYGDPGYAQFGTGSPYAENYPADQQGQAETGEAQQAWYRDDDRR